MARLLYPDTLQDVTPWDGIGTRIDGHANSKQIAQFAGADFHVSLRKFKTDDSDGIQMPGAFMTVRDDTKRALGVVSDRYKVFQNTESFAFLDSLVDNGEMTYESAGIVNGGRQFWALARMPSTDEITPEDVQFRYVFFFNSHDGKSSLYCIPTSVRPWCSNMFAMMLRKQTGVKHTGNMVSKLDEARKFISQFDVQFTLFRDSARILAKSRYNDTAAQEYIKRLFPMPEEPGRGMTMVENKIEEVRKALRLDRNRLASIKGTWWQLFNGITDATDHNSRRTVETVAQKERKFLDLTSGNGADFKARAFKLALEFAQAT